MKPLFRPLLFGCVLAGLSSCSADDPWVNHQGEGKINLKLTASSGLVEATTRQTRAEETLEAPDVAEFSVSLSKNDESYSRTWNTLDDFTSEESFPTGVYTLTAFYGDVAGEGFDKPYYEGTADVTVLEARTTDVSVEATLSNSLVSVGYTDAFKSYFSAWGATVHSEGNGFHEIPQGEKRPVFIVPGNVDISLDLTSQEGKTTKVQPLDFKAEPRHRYHVVFDVNSGNEGEMQLTVNIDETVEKESIVIDLTDELFTTPGPEVTPSGFVSGQTIEALEGSTINTEFIYNVVCRGKIRNATLTVNSSYIPSFGNEIDLCQSTVAALHEMGFNAKGFVNNPDRLAWLNVSEFVASLPAGHHEMTLVVKDVYARVSEPVTLVVENVPAEIKAIPHPTQYGTNDAVIEVAYNGSNPQKNITFTTPDDYGSWHKAEVKSVTEASRSRAFETKNYLFTIVVSDTERDVIPVKVFLRGVEKEEIQIPVIMPKYSVTSDPLATKVNLKVTTENQDFNSSITNSLRVFLTGPEADNVSMTRDPENGIIRVSGLKPGSDYTLQTTLSKGDNPVMSPALNFKTEAATPLPNGDLSELKETINMPGIQVGGQYRVSPIDYTLKSSIVRSEADGWASLNTLTCWSGSSNKNTWFLVPSTFVDNESDESGYKVATIRSVGYSHNGTTPSTSGGSWNTKYYCENAPSFTDAEKSIGEMFIGSYSYNGTASSSDGRTDGVAFSSRPSSLSFEYEYAPLNNEKGYASIEVLDASGAVIANGALELGKKDSMTAANIPLPAYQFGSKAALIKVSFKSSTAAVPAINIPTGGALNEGQGLGNKTMGANSYHAYAKGSELRIRNIKLNY